MATLKAMLLVMLAIAAETFNFVFPLQGNWRNEYNVVKHTFESPIKAKYVQFWPLTKYGWAACMRVELYTADGPVHIEQGLHMLSATSIYGDCCPANSGRLNFADGEAWCGGVDVALGNFYLQVELNSTMELTGVATQGNIAVDEGTSTYGLLFSTSGLTWAEFHGMLKKFDFTDPLQGNSNSTDIVKHTFESPITAKYVRFWPLTKFGPAACMRVELYTADGPVQIQQGLHTLSATSIYGDCCPADSGRLNFADGEPWCGFLYATLGSYYLQVELDSTMELTGVATQGNMAFDEGTSTYGLLFSADGNTWAEVGQTTITEINLTTINAAPEVNGAACIHWLSGIIGGTIVACIIAVVM